MSKILQRIIVTGDWHIKTGTSKRHKRLMDEFTSFIDWLVDYIEQDSAGFDYIINTGDVFDNNNPNKDEIKIYLDTMSRLCSVLQRRIADETLPKISLHYDNCGASVQSKRIRFFAEYQAPVTHEDR